MFIYGAIVQNCWIVPSLEQAMQGWLDMGFGPFLTMEVTVPEMRHRGETSPLEVRVAFTQAGEVQVELIEQTSPGGSAYSDMFGPGEGGFHHICRVSADYHAEVASLREKGIALAGEGKFGSLPFCYADTRAVLGCMTEIVQDAPQLRELYQAVRTAAADWDGSNPIRPMGAA